MVTDPSNPAPGRLRLVQRFVNTSDRYGGHDDLATPEQAADWLAEHQLAPPGARITPPTLEELLELREALRRLAAANTTRQPPDSDALATFNAIARRHPATVALDAEDGALGTSLAPAGADVPAVLCAVVHEAVLDETWRRLKACSNPECAWLFFDTSRSRTGRWCSMAACGSLIKARSYRRRRASSSRPESA